MTYNNLTKPTTQVRTPNMAKEWLTVLTEADTSDLIAPQDREAAQRLGAIAALAATSEDIADGVCAILRQGPAARKALDAVRPFFKQGGVIELRAFDPAGGGARVCCDTLDKPKGRERLEAFVRDHIGRRNLYIGVNPRKAALAGGTKAAKAEDVTGRRALVLDLDTKDAPDVDPAWQRTIAALRANGLADFVLRSGNGFHVWAHLHGVDDPAEVLATSGALAEAMARVGADNMSDPPRVARLPFTVNLPNTTKRGRGARIVLALPEGGRGMSGVTGKARTVTDVTDGLRAIATELGLPGRGAARPRAQSAARERGDHKTGHAAPSEALLRLGVGLLPNDQGHFDDRDDFAAVAHAIKGAARAGNMEAAGRKVFLDGFCARWDGNGDPAKDAELWDSIDKPHTGWGAVRRTLERVNPAGHAELKAAEAKAAFSEEAAATKTAIAGKALVAASVPDLTQIPPRAWLYGSAYIRGYVSMLVASGGTGKSALAMVEAVAMAAGKELLEGGKPHKALRVWMHNEEDGDTELRRRLAAALERHGVTQADLGGRLFLTSHQSGSLKLARQGREGSEIVPGVVDGMVEKLKAHQVDVLMLDPLGALHELPENSNEAANLLLGALREIATRANVAILLVHHTGKAAAMDMATAGAAASRGASAFVDGARSVRQLAAMTPVEASKFAVPEDERRRHVRIDNGKANLAPAEGARWVKLHGVRLGNVTAEYPDGDNVQTVCHWRPPTLAQRGALTPAERLAVQAAIAAAPPGKRRASTKSPGWVGYIVAGALDLALGDHKPRAGGRTPFETADRQKVRDVIAQGVDSGWMAVGSEQIASDRKSYPCVRIARPDVAPDVEGSGT